MADEQGAEPSGWELMRALTEFKADIKGDIAELKTTTAAVGSKVVSIELYNADKQGNTERHQRAEARIGTLEQNAVDAVKQRNQLRLTIALAIFSPIAAGAVTFLIKVVTP